MPPAGYPAFLQYLQSGRVRNVQCLIRPAGATDLVPEKVVDQGALTAVQGRRHRPLMPGHCVRR